MFDDHTINYSISYSKWLSGKEARPMRGKQKFFYWVYKKQWVFLSENWKHLTFSMAFPKKPDITYFL